MNTFNVAALFAANCRPRQLRLSPRAFQLLARSPSQDSTSQTRGNSIFVRNATIGSVTSSYDHSESELALGDDDVGDDQQEHVVLDKESTARRLQQHRKIFKTWMRTVPKSVAIITARKQDTPDRASGTVAATVSSFNTVAFEPELYVSFNLKQNSSTLKTILETKTFAVTFPANNKYGEKLADRFSRGDLPPPTKEKEEVRYHVAAKFNSVFTERGLKYPPCVVSMKNHPQNKASGFAFGMWYEYHSSMPIGDHVIVTAKALPVVRESLLPAWTLSGQPEDPFFTSRLTLGHVHGGYATSEQIRFESWKLDDISRLDASRSDRKAFCTSRLNMIASAQAALPPEMDADEKKAYMSVRHLLPEMKSKLERYYMAQLSALNSFTKPVPEMLADTINELASWEQLVVRQKRRISAAYLLNEKTDCLRRLALLESDNYDFQIASNMSTTDEELIDAVKEIAGDSRTKRLEGLRHYWRTRLRLVNIVQLDRIFEHSLSVVDNDQIDMHKWIDDSHSKFITLRRDWSVQMLVDSRKQYDRTLAHTRRSLMRAWPDHTGAGKTLFIQEMMMQCRTLAKAVMTLDWMIAKRQVHDGMADTEDLQPRLPQDAEIIEKTGLWYWEKLPLEKLVEEASQQIDASIDMEMSSANFEELLKGVMSSIKAKRQEGKELEAKGEALQEQQTNESQPK